MRDEYAFDDLTTRIYQQIQKVYGEPDSDEKHKQFYLMLAQIQSDHLCMKKMKITGDDRKFLEKMFSEVQNLKRETGRILRISTKRYSTQFEQPSPVNAKLLRLPRGSREENFLKGLPRSREKLRLKPLKASHIGKRRANQYGGCAEYDRYSRRSTSNYMEQYQVAKGSLQNSNSKTKAIYVTADLCYMSYIFYMDLPPIFMNTLFKTYFVFIRQSQLFYSKYFPVCPATYFKLHE
jgi:hypothetical protein